MFFFCTFACPKIDFDSRITATIVDVTTNDFKNFITHVLDGGGRSRIIRNVFDYEKLNSKNNCLFIENLLDFDVVMLVSRSMADWPGR